MNNYEKIKNMSIEEMARFLARNANCSVCHFLKECYEDKEDKFSSNSCKAKYLKWLESEVEE